MKRLLVIAMLVAACSGRAAATPTPTPEPTAAGYITRQEIGAADWPFVVPAGTLICDDDPKTGRMYVRFSIGDGIEYALNGSARDFGFPDLDKTILTDYPNRSALGPLIERGLALC